jgi:hypothetical protein
MVELRSLVEMKGGLSVGVQLLALQHSLHPLLLILGKAASKQRQNV